MATLVSDWLNIFWLLLFEKTSQKASTGIPYHVFAFGGGGGGDRKVYMAVMAADLDEPFLTFLQPLNGI